MSRGSRSHNISNQEHLQSYKLIARECVCTPQGDYQHDDKQLVEVEHQTLFDSGWSYPRVCSGQDHFALQLMRSVMKLVVPLIAMHPCAHVQVVAEVQGLYPKTARRLKAPCWAHQTES